MKIWELQQGSDLTPGERPAPVAGSGQVVIRMRAASLNYRDIMIKKGDYGPPARTSLIPLSDGAGEVVEVGANCSRFRVGDRVAGAFKPGRVDGEATAHNMASALGAGEVDGVLAELVALPETGVVRAPEHLSFEEAATLPCAGVTAWYALFEGGRLKAGETVLLQGTGGVSLFALAFAKLAGARVILTSSSDEKLEQARSMGADETINYSATPNWDERVLDWDERVLDWDERVLELTGGRGADYVVEVGGPDTLNKSLQAVRVGGQISLMGVLTGTKGEVNTAAILGRQIRVQGVNVGSVAMFENMNRAITQSHLRPVVDRVFPFELAREAFKYLESGQHFGKVVIGI